MAAQTKPMKATAASAQASKATGSAATTKKPATRRVVVGELRSNKFGPGVQFLPRKNYNMVDLLGNQSIITLVDATEYVNTLNIDDEKRSEWLNNISEGGVLQYVLAGVEAE